MTTYSNVPRLLKGGIVLVDPQTLAPIQGGPVPGGIIALQYNPDSITRTLRASAVGGEGRDRSEAMRLKGPPIETIKVDAEIDATDQLDNLANQYLGDPELYWRICDANYEARPDDVTDDPPETGAPRVIRIGLPPGVPAPGQS